ncbi:hypothetical protein SODALDRAFT_268011 [Sodiomyces alkalinus F11]|uniref:Jacalin-type lectin domain-containing protein n=1 Tax=Sodiomyces alkalinus (strain CBS 110278 / VKM F-3762 / F11) TaxID=1314773 RepID=A0A3N2Q7M9_SODAK|nr:hypothetical protein SODALDRAFT_268011 [Sodiomyces alkalinus F11]ROT42716.1 hypothetical protein SODALDRAFT_268011 [Sodiomyces alkalinus F11]
MAPAFLRELRRRSRASIRTEQSTDRAGEQYSTDCSSNASQGTVPTAGSVTPPSNHGSEVALDLHLKDTSGQSANTTPIPRPPPQPIVNVNTNRNSVASVAGWSSPTANAKANLVVSPYAPRVTNCADGTYAYQKNLVIRGTIGDPSQHSVDGEVLVNRLDHQFPPTSWAVCESHWKALVYLQPGLNRFRFDFTSPKVSNSSSSNPIHSSYLDIFMVPPQNTPPLQLAILLAKDSPQNFDSTPARAQTEGNGLDTAIHKYRMAAYLWQAFTCEQMTRHRMGRRSFAFEEEWVTGSSHSRDRVDGKMRSEARVHIIRTEKTVAQLRDLAQLENLTDDPDKSAFFNVVADAVRDYFRPLTGQKKYVSVLLLDVHWDKEVKTVTEPADAGGSSDDLNLAIFGSQYLQSYPSSLDEIRPAFNDCSRIEADFVSKHGNNMGSSWEVANAGMGGHLRSIGHMLGCPRQESGVMGDDFAMINRTFVAREPFSTRTKSKGGLILAKDECTWHALDCLRFRWHPCFRLPNDAVCYMDASIQAFPVEGGSVVLAAKTGVSHVEIMGEDDNFCRAWIRYGVERGLPKQVSINESEVRERLQEKKRKGLLRLRVVSGGGAILYIDDFRKLCSKSSSFKISAAPLGKSGFRSKQIGCQDIEDRSEAQEVVFKSAVKQSRVLSRVIVYHDPSIVYGLEFVYDDASTQILGGKGGKVTGDAFDLDVRRGEYIAGFTVRVSDRISGISISTSLGSSSPIYGDAFGGDLNILLPPWGYTVCGVAGLYGARLHSFGLLITR